jgi:hypothetical protein
MLADSIPVNQINNLEKQISTRTANYFAKKCCAIIVTYCR